MTSVVISWMTGVPPLTCAIMAMSKTVIKVSMNIRCMMSIIMIPVSMMLSVVVSGMMISWMASMPPFTWLIMVVMSSSCKIYLKDTKATNFW